MLIVVGLPFKNRLLQLGALCLTFGAAILTFSKMAMSLAILILAWQLVRWLRRISLVIIPIVAFASILIVQDVSSVFNTIAEQPILELGKSQKARVMAIGSILSAKIDRDTSTGRTELWAIGIKKAWERFPLGWGLGSFHHLIGGHYERGLWLGVHNTYLMLWGEGGALVGILVLLWIFTMILYASRSVLRSVALPWALIFLVSMMTGHSVLGHRYQNLALAVVFGLIALTASARELQQRRLAAAAISAQAGFAPAGRRFVTLETRA
jgi:O-antigen ligase